MMKHEFEKIAGYEVSWEDYNNIIEPMYNATDLDKFDFVKLLNRKQFDLGAKKKAIVKKMKEIAKHLKETCTHYTDYEAKEELDKLIEEYKDLIGAYGYIIHETEIWTCYYPRTITLYGKDYGDIKKIELI